LGTGFRDFFERRGLFAGYCPDVRHGRPPDRLSHFSKFVRPGYLRVGISGAVPSGVQTVAFLNPADNSGVLVAINSNTTDQTVSVVIPGTTASTQLTPWVTSANDNLAQKAPMALSGGRFSATLAAQSVTTFVAKP
jgi:glucuronoarabinoxylan endo-1,4-beta-xylanase